MSRCNLRKVVKDLNMQAVPVSFSQTLSSAVQSCLPRDKRRHHHLNEQVARFVCQAAMRFFLRKRESIMFDFLAWCGFFYDE